jgi:23S rRNA pseudouridine2605 synthase
MGIRLQRYLARCGLGSRRSCEELIFSGRITINDEKADEPGVRVEEEDIVKLDGKTVRPHPMRYFVLNKPRGVICVNKDLKGRPYVVDLIQGGRRMGLFPVGRLDIDTSGLIILTNDGDLANRIAHPRYEIRKTYQARVQGRITEETLKSIGKGVRLERGEPVKGIEVLDHSYRNENTDVILSLHEGRYHVVRRIFLAKGHRVRRLKRISIGNLSLGDLETGCYKQMTGRELEDSVGISKKTASDA